MRKFSPKVGQLFVEPWSTIAFEFWVWVVAIETWWEICWDFFRCGLDWDYSCVCVCVIYLFIYLFTRSTWTQLLVGPVHCAQNPHHFQRLHIGLAMALSVGPVYCSRDPQILLFSNFFIKNGFHGTIHTFKNYFAIVFSVFSFSNNKFNPNGPLVQ